MQGDDRDQSISRFLRDSRAVLSGRLDEEGRLVESNAALADLLGRRKARAIGLVVRPDDLDRWRRALAEVFSRSARVELSLALDVGRLDYLGFLARLEPGEDGTIGFLAVPVEDPFERLHRLSLAIDVMRKALQRRGRIDPLTGLGDRGRADQWLGHAINRAQRLGEPLACLMVDLDRFKAVNDTLGHLEGDRRLKIVASVLKRLDPPGLAARFGGDEFLILWPGLDRDAALIRVEGLRSALSDALGDGTVSIGLAMLREGEDASSLLHRADLALVSAKLRGRDRVECETRP
jgi:diguanylate cyclase (GGDEF)-like protein